jgi:hypothetical protein
LVSSGLWLTLIAGWPGEAAATSLLRQFALSLDGLIVDTSGPLPAFVDLSGFDLATGLGVVQVEYNDSPGAHAVLAFFDHDIDAATNTFFNEIGGVVGTPVAGESWEVDEPGFVLGDLYENFVSATLDEAVGMSVHGTTTFPDDVALALGWQFDLAPGEAASLLFSVDTAMPPGFHLFHSDPDSGETLYVTSTLRVIPEPGTGVLIAGGLMVCCAARRARRVGCARRD